MTQTNEFEMSDHTSVEVRRIPECDFCSERSFHTPAVVDGKTTMGPWAHMCHAHHNLYGVGLGRGRGQRLILKESK